MKDVPKEFATDSGRVGKRSLPVEIYAARDGYLVFFIAEAVDTWPFRLL